MVLILQGEKSKTLKVIFSCHGWKCLYGIYRLSNKGIIVYASTLSKEIGYEAGTNLNIRKALTRLKDLGLITRKGGINDKGKVPAFIYELTPLGKEIAPYIYRIVKTIFQNPKINSIDNTIPNIPIVKEGILPEELGTKEETIDSRPEAIIT